MSWVIFSLDCERKLLCLTESFPRKLETRVFLFFFIIIIIIIDLFLLMCVCVCVCVIEVIFSVKG